MKVAIILTGHMRQWAQCFPNFKERFLDRYPDHDVFIHTYSTEGYWIDGDDRYGVHPHSPILDVEAVREAYKPKDMVVEVWEDVAPLIMPRIPNFAKHHDKPQNTVSMYYKLLAGVQLMERYSALTGTQYDLVIRVRPDLVLYEDLPVFDARHFYTIFYTGPNRGTGDYLQASNQDDIIRFSKIGTKLEQLAQERDLFCPHVASYHFLNEHMKVSHVEFNIARTLQHTPNGQYTEWKK